MPETKYVPEVGAILDQLRERLWRDPESAIRASDMVRSILRRLLHLLPKIADENLIECYLPFGAALLRFQVMDIMGSQNSRELDLWVSVF